MRKVFVLFALVLPFLSCATSNPPNELLANGNFGAGTRDWDVGDDGSFEVVSGAAHIAVYNPQTNFTDIQFYYDHGLRFASGKQYRLSFTAHAPGDRSIRVQVVNSIVAPFSPMLEREIALAHSPVRYSYVFTSTGDTTLGGLAFQFGNDSGDFYLDDVSLIGN